MGEINRDNAIEEYRDYIRDQLGLRIIGEDSPFYPEEDDFDEDDFEDNFDRTEGGQFDDLLESMGLTLEDTPEGWENFLKDPDTDPDAWDMPDRYWD